MAIETSFTIKQISVEGALQEAESKVDRSAKKMDKDLNGAGSNAGKTISTTMGQAAKGMDAVAKAGGKIGSVMKNATQAIMGMASPVGLVSAAITAAISAITFMIEYAKKKAEQLRETFSWESKNANSEYERMQKTHNEDRSYLYRLAEINKMETIDNATKNEAIRIVDHLTQRYGDLGLSVDMTTGKIEGLVEATRGYNQAVLEQEKIQMRAALIKQSGVVQTNVQQEYNIAKNKGGMESLVNSFNPRTFSEWGMIAAEGLGGNGSSVRVPNQPTEAQKILDERMPLALQRYVGIVGEDAARQNKNWEKLQQYYTPREPTNEQKKIQADIAKTEEAIKKANTEAAKAGLEEQYEILQKMLKTQIQIETAYELQHDQNLSKKSVENWRKIYEEANQYYAMLNKIYHLVKIGNDTGTISQEKMQAQITSDFNAREKTLNSERVSSHLRKYQAERNLEETGYTKAQLYQNLKIDHGNIDDQIIRERMDLENLKSEYEKLNKELKEYDRYKNDKGEIVDPKILEQYLDLSNKIRENKLKQIETENKITNAETEQLNIQSKMKAYELEAAKARQEALKEQMKKTLNNLFTNVLGDTKETTNDLTRRGGYLSNVNTINPLQVNRQILNTVITANNYLSAIKVAINNAGRI